MLVCKSNPIFEGGTNVTERAASAAAAAAMCIVNLATMQGDHAHVDLLDLQQCSSDVVAARRGLLQRKRTIRIVRGLYNRGRALISAHLLGASRTCDCEYACQVKKMAPANSYGNALCLLSARPAQRISGEMLSRKDNGPF